VTGAVTVAATATATATAATGSRPLPGSRRAPFAATLLLAGLAAVCAAVVPAPAAGRDAEPRLRLGVRCDAPPFSYVDVPNGGTCDAAVLAANEPRGYMVDLCVQALKRLGRRYDFVPVTAKTRLASLAGTREDAAAGKGESGGTVDILCEPTTINLTRIDGGYGFSQIVFLSGTSYLYRPDVAVARGSGRIDIRYLRGTTAEGPANELKSRLQHRFGTESKAAIEVSGVDSHHEGVGQVCSGEIAYYVGDKDILAAMARRTTGCKALPSNVFFSIEPYAVAVSPARPDLLVQLQGAIYHLFSDGTVRAIFHANFGRDAQMSPLLEAMMKIAALPE